MYATARLSRVALRSPTPSPSARISRIHQPNTRGTLQLGWRHRRRVRLRSLGRQPPARVHQGQQRRGRPPLRPPPKPRRHPRRRRTAKPHLRLCACHDSLFGQRHPAENSDAVDGVCMLGVITVLTLVPATAPRAEQVDVGRPRRHLGASLDRALGGRRLRPAELVGRIAEKPGHPRLRRTSVHLLGYDWRLSPRRLQRRDGWFTQLRRETELSKS